MSAEQDTQEKQEAIVEAEDVAPVVRVDTMGGVRVSEDQLALVSAKTAAAVVAELKNQGALAPSGPRRGEGWVPPDEIRRLLTCVDLVFRTTGVRLRGNEVLMHDDSFLNDPSVVQAYKEFERAKQVYGAAVDDIEFTYAEDVERDAEGRPVGTIEHEDGTFTYPKGGSAAPFDAEEEDFSSSGRGIAGRGMFDG